MFAFLFYSKVLFTRFRFSSSNFTESIFWKFITICRYFTCLIKNGMQQNLYRLLEFRTKRAKIQNFTDLLMIFSALLQLSVCLFELKCKGFFWLRSILLVIVISYQTKNNPNIKLYLSKNWMAIWYTNLSTFIIHIAISRVKKLIRLEKKIKYVDIRTPIRWLIKFSWRNWILLLHIFFRGTCWIFICNIFLHLKITNLQ